MTYIPIKKVLLIIVLGTLNFSVFGQTDTTASDTTIKDIVFKPTIGKFTFAMSGMTDYVIGKFDTTFKKEDIYKKSLNWVKESYKNPTEVIKTTIENDLIRIEGIKVKGLTMQTAFSNPSYNLKYTIEMKFKDGKLMFDPIQLYIYVPPSQYVAGGWQNMSLSNFSNFYKKDRKTGEYKIIQKFSLYPSQLELLFNDLSSSVFNYIIKPESKKDEW